MRARLSSRPVVLGLALTGVLGLSAGCVKTTTPKAERAQEGERITYRVEDPTSTPTAIRTQVVEFTSPYLASQITYDDPAVAAPQHLVGGFAWTREGIFTIGEGGSVQQTQPTPPEAAPPATHLLVSLPIAKEQGLAVETGKTGTYLGRTCTEWKTKEPLDGAPFEKGTAEDYALSCIDAEGLILREDWFLSKKIARVREATAVEVVKALGPAELFKGKSPAPVPEGISSDAVAVTTLNKQSQGIEVTAPPAGYVLDRAVSIASAIPGQPITQLASLGEGDAFLKGRELISIRRIRNLLGTPLVPGKGATVDLGALGKGHLLPTSTGVQISVVASTGVLVIAESTSGPDELITWLKTVKVNPLQ